MSHPNNGESPTLRERKRQRTRSALIDAAVDLCLRRGYDNTTVEQIAEAADVSPRTFSRYFSSKDAVFIAVLDDLADEITAAIRQQPSDLGPMEALRAAHVAVLMRVARVPLARLTTERVALILRVVNSSPALRQAAIDYRSPSTVAVLAEKMGVPVDDPHLELAVTLFSTSIVTACADLVDGNGDVVLGPEAIVERLERTLNQVALLTSQLQTSTQAEIP